MVIVIPATLRKSDVIVLPRSSLSVLGDERVQIVGGGRVIAGVQLAPDGAVVAFPCGWRSRLFPDHGSHVPCYSTSKYGAFLAGRVLARKAVQGTERCARHVAARSAKQADFCGWMIDLFDMI